MFAIAEEETMLIKCEPENNNMLCTFSSKEDADKYMKMVTAREGTECVIIEVENPKKKSNTG